VRDGIYPTTTALSPILLSLIFLPPLDIQTLLLLTDDFLHSTHTHARALIILTLTGHALAPAAAFLGKQHGVYVREDPPARDGDPAQQPAELLVVLHGQGDVTRHDPRLPVVARGVPGQFEYFGGQVLEDGREVDRRAGPHAGGVLAGAEVSTDAAHGELEAGLGGRRRGLFFAASSLAFPRHDIIIVVWIIDGGVC